MTTVDASLAGSAFHVAPPGHTANGTNGYAMCRAATIPRLQGQPRAAKEVGLVVALARLPFEQVRIESPHTSDIKTPDVTYSVAVIPHGRNQPSSDLVIGFLLLDLPDLHALRPEDTIAFAMDSLRCGSTRDPRGARCEDDVLELEAALPCGPLEPPAGAARRSPYRLVVFADLFDHPDVAVAETDDPRETPLPPEEAAAVEGAAEKRRREFAAGRSCARLALGELGLSDAIIPRNPDRTPAWPDGMVGSISHTSGHCAAAVARDRRIVAVGIDVEGRTPLKDGIVRRICSEDERAHLAALGDHPVEVWAKLVFSAKESFFKAYFPREHVGLGFREAEVEIDPAGEGFRLCMCNEDKPALAGRREVTGRFAFGPAHVFTAILVEAR